MALSVGQVAGVINVGVVFLQLTFPLLLVYILAGLAPESSNAITWTVTGRFLNGSWWPSILRTDGAATSKVSKRVVFLSTLSTLGLLLLAIAAVVTPLGLYSKVAATSTQSGVFASAQDTSPIGQTTLSRDDYNTSRMCGFFTWMSCPGQDHGFYITQNISGSYINWDSDDAYISSVIPSNLSAIFSSGRDGDRSTVATPFDLEYRSYTLERDEKKQDSVLLNSTGFEPKVDLYEKRCVGDIQYGDMIVLANDFVVRDGIVADMKNGGLGFRNHTIPLDAHSGAEWSENLLWLEPESVCVTNNLSLEFRIASLGGSSDEVYLVDQGGLVHMQKDYPYIDLNQTQLVPQLYGRAHKGAVLTNFNLRAQLNVSENHPSSIGRKFLLPGSYFEPGVARTGSFDSGIPGVYIDTDPRQNLSLMENIANTISVGLVTQGFGGEDQANISHIANHGGAVLGAFYNIDATDSGGRFDPGTNYSAPLYSCSTSVRAFIMNVTFFTNGTSLDKLVVKAAKPQTYESNATTPLWAVEKTEGWNLSDIQPIWGLVGDEHEHNPALWTMRRDYMYLPAGSAALGLGSLSSSDSLGCEAPISVLAILYSVFGGVSTQVPDFSGQFSLPLKRKWQELSKSEKGTEKILGLIWTDITANYITSSRGQLNSKFSSTTTYVQRQEQHVPDTATVEVLSYGVVTRYHLVYAILAIVVLALYSCVLIVALIMCVTRRSTFHALKSLLQQTSVGRAVIVERYKQESTGLQAKTMNTRTFIREFGDEKLDIVKEHKAAAVPSQQYQPVKVEHVSKAIANDSARTE
ncbi:hypothetical protein PV08_05471 [Exophiala spinifera]|uniref:Uncharacterized protein n=1 Tax=Exophiala spinifera TaxID=91928 RepID=A0A0D2B9X6_9EURO|nr:uncharacterized protein PV08_05471 [Exophiala spinifera]KIW15425.1 hypothetical protein PV08_05471 [Exophiala spinifera]